MSRKYLTPIDLAKNELQNARIQNLSSDPSSPVLGQTYFNTTSNKLRTYNGSTWDEYGTGAGSGSVTSVSVVSANGFAGSVATSSTTPAITLSTTATGLLKGNGTAISAATSGTDYAPPTATTSALKGNGSGGFSAATLNDVGTPTTNFSMGGQRLTTLSDPTSSSDAATKNYVDSYAQGIDFKSSVAVATTANGTLSTAYANGQTVDGVTLTTGMRILLKNQTTGADNGIYTVNASGAPTRATDADTTGELSAGALVYVEQGTTNGSSQWVLTTTGTITIGTTSQTWTQFSGAALITAGTGLTKTGNTISLTTPVSASNGGAGTVSGILKANGSGTVSAAVSATDYAPATTGSSILKASSGGFANAVAGTDYAAAPSGSSVLKANGSGGFAAAYYSATIGDGSSTSIAVTHSLGNQYVIAQVYDASTNAQVECDITLTSSSVTTFAFASAPASNAYRVVIVG